MSQPPVSLTRVVDQRDGYACVRCGISLEVVAKLLGHSNVTVTAATYGHLTIEDARKAMEQSGWFTGTAQVRL